MIRANTPSKNLITMIEIIEDVQECSQNVAIAEQARRNLDWLQGHWQDLLPQARGKYVAVAGQQAFVGETGAEALAQAEAVHPEDTGRILHFLKPVKGLRIDAVKW